jgi:outer membrane protein OmpA-like peptidoglycan-associated protein
MAPSALARTEATAVAPAAWGDNNLLSRIWGQKNAAFRGFDRAAVTLLVAGPALAQPASPIVYFGSTQAALTEEARAQLTDVADAYRGGGIGSITI